MGRWAEQRCGCGIVGRFHLRPALASAHRASRPAVKPQDAPIQGWENGGLGGSHDLLGSHKRAREDRGRAGGYSKKGTARGVRAPWTRTPHTGVARRTVAG